MRSHARPIKRLGQHFLRDRSLSQRIVESLGIGESDQILEIGPGEGALTEFLLESSAERIVGVEIDRRLAGGLRRRFGHDPRFELLEEDFLKLDLLTIIKVQKKIRVVGSLPYNITSPILFKILDHRRDVQDLTVAVQKEVGERIASPPGTKSYGIPSVLFQLFSQMDVLFSISRNAFSPKPEVDSLVLRLKFYETPLYNVKDALFFRLLLKTVFGQRRKMLKNTLKALVEDERMLHAVSLDLHRRPEELSVADFVELSNTLTQESCGRTHRGRDALSKR